MKLDKLKEDLLEPLFNKKDVSFSYRTLNHYDKKNVLLSHRIDQKAWRRFNGIELVWLNLVEVLRDIGMPLSKIVQLSHNIFTEGKYGSIDKANFINKSFIDEVLYSIIDKKDLYILIFNDCSYTFHDSTSLAQWHNGIYKNEPHINVPLKPLISEIIQKVQEVIKK